MGICEEGSRVSLDVAVVVLAVVTCRGEGGVGGVLLMLDAKFSCWRWLATISSLTNFLGKDNSLHVREEKRLSIAFPQRYLYSELFLPSRMA